LGLPESVIAHDVEGLEHHVSPETFQALESLTRYLSDHPDVLRALRKTT
jgi:Mn-dependent DtxR family transcriptional regulator